MAKLKDCFIIAPIGNKESENRKRSVSIYVLAVVLMVLLAGCDSIRAHRQIQQPLGSALTTGIGGTIFRLDKIGDLPNAFGGRDIWGGKVDKGFAEMKLAGIDGDILTLEVLDINRQSSETTMDRYKPFQKNAIANVDVQTSISIGLQNNSKPYEVEFDTKKQKDIIIAGIRVTFINIQPYSIEYSLEDIQAE